MLMTVALKACDTSRGRIARYCGGFEIHCPLDAGVQIPLSALLSATIDVWIEV